MTTLRAAQVAAAHLRETGNPAVMVGDVHLLHEIATKLGMEHEGWRTPPKVLARIDRTNRGDLVKTYFSLPERGMGRCRCFTLPEHAKP